jgi:predicted RNA-binding Zn ribbon-like protein
MKKYQVAPGRLEIIRSLINTRDLELRTDQLSTIRGLRDWLATHLPESSTDSVTALTVHRPAAVEFREALRRAASANTGRRPPTAMASLNVFADRTPLRVEFTGDSASLLIPAGDDQPFPFGHLLGIVTIAMIDGSWSRLKICPAEDCRWAFYDYAKNQAGVWCQMAECGNRNKVRVHRLRSNRDGHPART